MTHASVPPEQRKELGIDNSLIRLSVGLEDTEDLLADLDQALKKAVSIYPLLAMLEMQMCLYAQHYKLKDIV